jgi:hypothetical protein
MKRITDYALALMIAGTFVNSNAVARPHQTRQVRQIQKSQRVYLLPRTEGEPDYAPPRSPGFNDLVNG